MEDIFKGTRGPQNARIILVGEAWGAREEQFGKPFMGESGNELKNMLKEAGIDPEEILYTNVVSARPEDNNFRHFLHRTLDARDAKLSLYRGIYPQQILLDGVHRLEALIAHVKPKVIICMGAWAMWAVTDKYHIKAGNKKDGTNGYKLAAGIDTYRGSMEWSRPELGRIPVMSTYHPAAILRMWPWRFPAVSDLRKVRRYLKAPVNERVWGYEPTLRRHIAPEPSLVEAWCEAVLESDNHDLTLDLETYGGRIHIIGLSQPGSSRLVIPFMHVTKEGTSPTYFKSDFVRIYCMLRQLLTKCTVRLVGQNLLFDAQYLYNEFHYVPKIGFDTMVAMHTLWPAWRRGLDYMASIFCDRYTYWKEDRKNSLANESTEDGCLYNALDLDYTEEVAAVLRQCLESEGMTQLFSDRMELVEILLDMMIHGVRVNREERRKQSTSMLMTLEDLEHWMEGALPDYLKPAPTRRSSGKRKGENVLWYESDTKLREVFYENLGLTPIRNKDTGAPTLDRDALHQLSLRYPNFAPLFGALTLWRSSRVFSSTFLDATLDPDGMFRCSYTITTETGRLASSENVFDRGGNLANIPRDREPLTIFNAIEALS